MRRVSFAALALALLACVEAAPPEGASEPWSRRLKPPASRAVAGDLSALTGEPPAAHAARNEPAVDVVGKVLPNGIEVLVAQRGHLPFVEALVMLDRGVADEGGGIAALMPYAMLYSSDHYTFYETLTESDTIGTRLGGLNSSDWVGVSYRTERSLFFQLFDNALYGVAEPSLSSDEMDLVKDEFLARRAARTSAPFSAARETLTGMVLGNDHPYATPPRIDAETTERLRAFRDHHIAPDRISVLVAGRMEPERVFRFVEQRLGGMKPRPSPPRPPMPVPRRQKARLYVIDRPGSGQAVVGLGYPGVAATDPHASALRVATSRLTHGIRSLVNGALREKQGKTYGVHGDAAFLRGAGLVRLMFGVPEADAASSAKLALALVDQSTRDPLDDDTLEDAKLAAYREVMATPATNTEALHMLAWLRGLGVSYDTPRKWGSEILGLRAEQVTSVATRYLRRENAQVVVIGDRAKLEGPLRAALPDLEWLQ